MTKTERGTLIKEASRHNKMASRRGDGDRHLNHGEKLAVRVTRICTQGTQNRTTDKDA